MIADSEDIVAYAKFGLHRFGGFGSAGEQSMMLGTVHTTLHCTTVHGFVFKLTVQFFVILFIALMVLQPVAVVVELGACVRRRTA
jgi:hypothetical protein